MPKSTSRFSSTTTASTKPLCKQWQPSSGRTRRTRRRGAGRPGSFSWNGLVEEAEQSLEKAFAINANYPFGHMLQGMFRQQEGEMIGALILFRKAADAYAPDAAEPLAYIHELIADIELRLNRPVAARAALKRSMNLSPGNADLRQAFQTLFGPESRLPAAARQDYVFSHHRRRRRSGKNARRGFDWPPQ